VEVPRDLRTVLKKRRFVRSLQTQSLDEANRKKHAVVTQIKRLIEALSKTPDQIEARALAKAMDRRREYLAASSQEIRLPDTADTISERDFVIDDIRSEWEQLRKKQATRLQTVSSSLRPQQSRH
jgi:flagellin-specific chaperone FliS